MTDRDKKIDELLAFWEVVADARLPKKVDMPFTSSTLRGIWGSVKYEWLDDMFQPRDEEDDDE